MRCLKDPSRYAGPLCQTRTEIPITPEDCQAIDPRHYDPLPTSHNLRVKSCSGRVSYHTSMCESPVHQDVDDPVGPLNSFTCSRRRSMVAHKQKTALICTLPTCGRNTLSDRPRHQLTKAACIASAIRDSSNFWLQPSNLDGTHQAPTGPPRLFHLRSCLGRHGLACSGYYIRDREASAQEAKPVNNTIILMSISIFPYPLP